MNINTSQTSLKNLTSPSRPAAASPQQATESTPSDTFTFSDPKFASKLGYGLLGATPGLGMMANFASANGSAIDGKPVKEGLATAGFVSNFAGTAALFGGISTGSTTALLAGLALLGLSGASAAYAHS